MAKKHKSKNNATLEVVKASRKGSREAELEFATGFTSNHKTHKSKKLYARNSKHKKVVVE